MAYKVKRQELVTKDLELCNADGTVVKTIRVELDADNMVRKLSEKHLALINALKNVREVKDASTEEEKANGVAVLGAAVIDLFEAVFGKEDAKAILDFYGNRYVEMCQEVVPFITQIVIPEVRKIAKQNKKAALVGYSRRNSVFSGFRK